MVLLKIPIVALFLIVRWAVRADARDRAGAGRRDRPAPRPLHPHHPRSRLPRPPRRGPHGEPRARARRRACVRATAVPRGQRAAAPTERSTRRAAKPAPALRIIGVEHPQPSDRRSTMSTEQSTIEARAAEAPAGQDDARAGRRRRPRDTLTVTDNRTGQHLRAADHRRHRARDRPAPDQDRRRGLRADGLRPGVHEHGRPAAARSPTSTATPASSSTAATRSSSCASTPPTSRSPTC